MLAHLLYCFVAEEYPQVLLENLSKNSQGSLFVSLFNFQGPLPLKRRAFCILPHLRRFVNTFFAACPFFSSGRLFGAFCFCEAALFQELEALSRERLLILSNHLPFVNSFFSFFLPFFTPLRAFISIVIGLHEFSNLHALRIILKPMEIVITIQCYHERKIFRYA